MPKQPTKKQLLYNLGYDIPLMKERLKGKSGKFKSDNEKTIINNFTKNPELWNKRYDFDLFGAQTMALARKLPIGVPEKGIMFSLEELNEKIDQRDAAYEQRQKNLTSSAKAVSPEKPSKVSHFSFGKDITKEDLEVFTSDEEPPKFALTSSSKLPSLNLEESRLPSLNLHGF